MKKKVTNNSVCKDNIVPIGRRHNSLSTFKKKGLLATVRTSEKKKNLLLLAAAYHCGLSLVFFFILHLLCLCFHSIYFKLTESGDHVTSVLPCGAMWCLVVPGGASLKGFRVETGQQTGQGGTKYE